MIKCALFKTMFDGFDHLKTRNGKFWYSWFQDTMCICDFTFAN